MSAIRGYNIGKNFLLQRYNSKDTEFFAKRRQSLSSSSSDFENLKKMGKNLKKKFNLN